MRTRRGGYGSPRVHAELTLGLGLVVNEKRVARLMRQAGVRGLYVRRRRGCTVRNPDAESASDLVNRQFHATAPNRLWLTDITEHPTADGKLYCAAVMDVYSRRIVGWSMAAPWRRTSAPSWSSTRSAWPSCAAPRTTAKPSCIPTTDRNTRHGHSGSDSRKPDCWARWAASEIVMTTR
jgi:transposase InsO family protein